jgi:hypothetical protein
MKLNELGYANTAVKALKSNFDFNLDVTKLDRGQTFNFLTKVNNALKEAKLKPDFVKSQTNENYLKMTFIAQALNEHYKSFKNTRIVVENKAVEDAQNTLAAQDMVDSVQKMIEQVNDMLVKELPALTDSLLSEMGPEQSGQFNQLANEALTSLNQALSQSKQVLQQAMGAITGGDAGFDPNAGGDEMAVTDIAVKSPEGDADAMMAAAGPAAGAVPAELPAEEPEEEMTGGVGRAKR